MELNFNEKKGFICDMDGVIYHGNIVLPGVEEFIRWLHEEKKEYLPASGYRRVSEGAGPRLFRVCHRRGRASQRPI